MRTSRLEAFSDGVIAIIITIMVLELHVPHDDSTRGLLGLLPVLLSYILSFVTVAIYWINHHHLIHLVQQVSTRLLWLNVHFLFWLSLLPFVTGLLGADVHSSNAAALYGLIAVGCSASYSLLRQFVTRQIASARAREEEGVESARFKARNAMSVALLIASVPLAFVSPWLSIALFCVPPVLYFMPDDRRVNRILAAEESRNVP